VSCRIASAIVTSRAKRQHHRKQQRAGPERARRLNNKYLVTNTHSHTYTLNMAANVLNTVYRFAIPLAAGVGLAQASLYDVKGGNRAIIFDRLSGVREGVVNEGTHFLIPWLQKAIIYDAQEHLHNHRQQGLADGELDPQSPAQA
jgi:hypothetical protein